jgi:hypothetical protein
VPHWAVKMKLSPTISASAKMPEMKRGPAGLSVSELRHCVTSSAWESIFVFINSSLGIFAWLVNLLFPFFLNVV